MTDNDRPAEPVEHDDRDAWLRSAFSGERAPGPCPVPPPEFELERVAAQLDLLGNGGPAACRHCSPRWVPISSSGHADARTVFRAAELRHEQGCPDADA